MHENPYESPAATQSCIDRPAPNASILIIRMARAGLFPGAYIAAACGSVTYALICVLLGPDSSTRYGLFAPPPPRRIEDFITVVIATGMFGCFFGVIVGLPIGASAGFLAGVFRGGQRVALCALFAVIGAIAFSLGSSTFVATRPNPLAPNMSPLEWKYWIAAILGGAGGVVAGTMIGWVTSNIARSGVVDREEHSKPPFV